MNIEEVFHWIESEKSYALDLIIQWAKINSYSANLKGLNQMQIAIREAFEPFSDHVEEIAHNSSPVTLVFSKRNSSSNKILLGGHMDTVYPESQFFPIEMDLNYLYGPGVADMKGGLVVALIALKAFETFVKEPKIGWIFICNPDEEIGSPYSKVIFEACAKEAAFGLLFEPAFPDGGFVKNRKGSMTFTIDVQGIPAHVGRAFSEGRNAVHALSRLIDKSMNKVAQLKDTTLNYAYIEGGQALNIVSASARCKGNLRAFQEEELKNAFEIILNKAKEIEIDLGVKIKIELTQTKAAKIFNKETEALFKCLEKNAQVLELPYKLHSSGGLSDGNILSGFGLSSIDTLGVVGGDLHTTKEYMEINSLVERIKLTFLLLNDFNQKFFSINVNS